MALPTRARADTPVAWTLESVVNAALEQSPEVQRARAQLRIAEAQGAYGRMPVVGNPVVGARALIGKPDDPAATYSLMVGLPFDVARRRRAWATEARRAVSAEQARMHAVENTVRAQAQQAFVDKATAQLSKVVAQDAAATARELLEHLEARLSQGAATAIDISIAQTQYAQAEADLALADRRLVEADYALRRVINAPAAGDLGMVALPDLTVPDGVSETSVAERALLHRAELRAFGLEARRLEATERRLRAEAVGPLTLGLDAERQGVSQPNSSVGASASFELPFVNTNQGARAVARAERSSQKLERTLEEREVARQAVTALHRLEAARRELRSLRETALPAAQRTLEMVRTMLDVGAADYFRLLTARERAYALRMRHVEALRAAWASRLELERAMGGWE